MKADFKEFSKGLIKENPTFVIMLGMCPTLAVTTQVVNAFSMGFGVLFVLLCSNVIISLLKKVIPSVVRIPCYIVIISAFVTILEMLFHAFLPDIYSALGVYLPLIVVNCIILGRAEAFAGKHNCVDSALDALGMGLGFTFALTLIALIREISGSGTITLFPVCGWDGKIIIPVLSDSPIRVLALPAGALLLMGYLKGLINYLSFRKQMGNKK